MDTFMKKEKAQHLWRPLITTPKGRMPTINATGTKKHRWRKKSFRWFWSCWIRWWNRCCTNCASKTTRYPLPPPVPSASPVPAIPRPVWFRSQWMITLPRHGSCKNKNNIYIFLPSNLMYTIYSVQIFCVTMLLLLYTLTTCFYERIKKSHWTRTFNQIDLQKGCSGSDAFVASVRIREFIDINIFTAPLNLFSARRSDLRSID